MSAILSLSSPHFTSDCSQVVDLLRRHRIMGDVTPNRTLLDEGQEEVGCRVVLANATQDHARDVWETARRLPGVRCAHVALGTRARTGCVFDVLAPTRCPGLPGRNVTDSMDCR